MLKKTKLVTSLFLLSCCTLATAANFQLFEQSATLLGQADAGTAVSDDPSVQFYNPAATAFFDKINVGLSGIYIQPNINYSTTTATNLSNKPITGQSGSPAQNAVVPAGFVIYPLNKDVTFGFGMTVPFGLSTSYGGDAMSRYFAMQSKLQTINLNPSIAYKFNNQLSGGLGYDLQYMSATLSQAVDGNTVLFYPYQPGDIYLKNTASDWASGWNIGLYYKPLTSTRIGLSYRSQISHHLTGSSQIQNPPADQVTQWLLAVYGVQNSDVSGNITLPPYTTLSLQQDITAKWSVMSDAEYIQWDKIQQLVLNFSNQEGSVSTNNLQPAVIPLNYHNTWRVSLGQSYKFTHALTGRMGVAFDQSPLPSQYATARIPDSDRYWLTTGASYALTPDSTISLSYAHIFFRDSSVNQTLSGEPLVPTSAHFAADYRANANLFGAQFNTKFG